MTRRRHLGRGKHVASGEEGSGRGRRARKVPAQVEESRPANRRTSTQRREAGREGGRQVVFFTGKGISETRPYLGGRANVSCLMGDWRGRRRRRKREGLTVHTIEQAARRQTGRAECILCFAISLGGGGVAPGMAGRKEGGRSVAQISPAGRTQRASGEHINLTVACTPAGRQAQTGRPRSAGRGEPTGRERRGEITHFLDGFSRMMHIPQVGRAAGGMALATEEEGKVYTALPRRLKQRALTALTAPLL